jgi:hypothetical protein
MDQDSTFERDAQGKQFDDGVGNNRFTTPAVPLKRITARRKRTSATRRQLAANRRNALQSTGPRTLTGRKISAKNALTHGLTSSSVLLPGDDPEEFRGFAGGIKIYWSPQGQQEEALVQLITTDMWVLLRLRRIEAGALSYIMNDENDPAYVWRVVLEILARYSTTRARSVSQATCDLKRLQDRRRLEECLPAAQRLMRLEEKKTTMTALIAQHSPPTTPTSDFAKRTQFGEKHTVPGG